ncbi:BatA and WFA domain-containing protein [soil metagenome]
MSFLIPAGFGLAALAGPLIVLYMLRSRRPRVEVPSIMLWEKAEIPVSSAVPWQKLRWTPLLLLQLAVLAAFVLTLARPFYREQTLLGPHTALVFDTSGSMGMAGRLETAKTQALSLVSDLSEANQVSIIEAGPNPRVLLAFGRDPALVTEAINSLEAGGGVADLSGAVRLARGLATPDRPTSVLLLTDGGSQPLPEEPVEGAEMLRYDDFGDNLAVAAWSLAPSTEGTTRAFLNLVNYGAETRTVRAEMAVNDLPAGSIELEVPAQGSARETTPIDAGPGDRLTVRLLDNADSLPLDDSATLIVGSAPEQLVSVLGEGSPFLEALVDAVPGFTNQGEGTPAIVISDGGPLPTIDRPTWLIAPEATPEGVTASQFAGNLAVTYQRPGEPILDAVDLSGLVVGEAQVVVAPRWLTLVRAGDVPLILLGEINGQRVAYFTFDITKSNLPVQVGFPILGARTLSWLAGATSINASTDAAGTPIGLATPAGSLARVTMPGGEVRELVEGSAQFADTDQPGVYEVSYIDAEGAVTGGPVAVRTFVADESAGASRDIATTGAVTAAEEASVRIREWAPWVIALALALMAIEWWVGHQRPFLPRRKVVTS